MKKEIIDKTTKKYEFLDRKQNKNSFLIFFCLEEGLKISAFNQA